MASGVKPQQRRPSESGEEPAAKRTRQSGPSVSGEPSDRNRVELNPADCDLDFDVEGNGLQGHALSENGFAYCWSGARATIGITGGKYCFGCKIISHQPVNMEDTPPDQQHVCRVGISRGDDPVGNLGESEHSFGFGGTGKFSNAGKFFDYGAKFGVNDTIVCCVNLENGPLASVGFSKNGKWLGTARQFDAGPRGLGVVNSALYKLPWESALFPHVLLKNAVVQMQFSIEDGLISEEGFRPWCCALQEGNAITGPSFLSPKECEVLMMVGLPASGKTTWAEKWVKEHPEKRYVLLGTNHALDQMKVPGLLRKQNYGERFDRLMDRATGIFNTLLARAAKTPRNYILDQTNVYKSARKRKLKAFTTSHKIAVVIFPKPDELKFRAEKRFKEMGKEVPTEAVNEMLANYALPVSKDMPGADEFFDQVIFPELSREEALRYLKEMKQALGSASVMNGKSDFSPYSRQSSVQSFTSPSAKNKINLDSGRSWETSHSPSPLSCQDYRNSLQLNSAYPRSSLYGAEYSSPGYQSRSRDVSLPAPTGSPYESYSNNGRTSIPINELDPYGSYSGSDPFGWSSIRGVSDPYRRHVADAYGSPNFGRPSFVNRNDYEDPRTPISYGKLVNRTMPEAEHHAVREPAFQQHSSFPGNPLVHSSPGANLVERGVFQSAREPPFNQHRSFQSTYDSAHVAPEGQYYEGYPPSGTRYR